MVTWGEARDEARVSLYRPVKRKLPFRQALREFLNAFRDLVFSLL